MNTWRYALLVVALSSLTSLASAEEFVRRINLTPGQALTIPVSEGIKRLAIADPAIAEALPIDGNSIYLVAKKVGRTTLILWSRDNASPRHFQLDVDRDLAGLQEQLKRMFPEETTVTIAAIGDQIVLGGTLKQSLSLEPILTAIKAIAGVDKIVVALPVSPPPQVLLDVKVAEVSKTLIDRIGTKLELASSGSRSITLLTEFLSRSGASLVSASGDEIISLDFEEKNGLIKILAEPSILALSGQQGEFLAGGKIFIPVVQTATVGANLPAALALEEREFGVGVKFLPEVLPDGRINLKMSAEVSEVSTTGTLISGGNSSSSLLPTITSRKTATTVQLRDGQSFAVGGLTKDNVRGSAAGLPGLANLPILGALFRSTDFQNDRSELVFVVTARLVKEPNAAALPTDDFAVTSRGKRLATGEFEQRPR